MKFNKILLGSLLVLGLGACNNEKGTDKGGDDTIKNAAYAQLSLSFADDLVSKATTVKDSITDAGSEAEQTITNVNIIFVDDKDNKIVHNELIEKSRLTPDAISTAYNTPTFAVPEGTYTVYVGVNMGTLANNFQKDGTFDADAFFSAVNGDASDYATSGNFLMTNYIHSKKEAILSRADNTESNPLRIQMEVNRAVAKIEYNPGRPARTFTFDVSTTSGGTAGTVTTDLVAMQPVLLNTVSYVFGHYTAPNYIDPNFGDNTSQGNLTDASNIDIDNMESLGNTTSPAYPSIYCLENTDATTVGGNPTPANHFTGIMFQAKHTPKTDMFHTDVNLAIDATLETNGTFFVYNNRFFANKTGFLAYYKDNSTSSSYTAVEGLLNNVETDNYVMANSNTLMETYGIAVYYKGMSYYMATIGHSSSANPNDGQLTDMEYGVVRNHWYKVGVTSISGFGDVTPDLPDDAAHRAPRDQNALCRGTDGRLPRGRLRAALLAVIIGMTGWATLARLLRAETMKVSTLDFVTAARALGVSHATIMRRHVLPNVLHIVLIVTVLDFSGIVLYEAVLSYVGVGVDPSMHSFGTMINAARSELSRSPMVWWNLAASFLFLLAIVLPANLFAAAVRDAFDPRVVARSGAAAASLRKTVSPALGADDALPGAAPDAEARVEKHAGEPAAPSRSKARSSVRSGKRRAR